jgi:hypothetical protein
MGELGFAFFLHEADDYRDSAEKVREDRCIVSGWRFPSAHLIVLTVRIRLFKQVQGRSPCRVQPAIVSLSLVGGFPMRTITCQTRLQQGVAAFRGVTTAWVRLGGKDRVHGKFPQFPISMRHPSLSSAALNPTLARHNPILIQDVDAAALRTGRSACSVGVLVPQSSALRATLGSGRPPKQETRSTTIGGLLPPKERRTGKRLLPTSADFESTDRTRYAGSTRGRGVV